MQLSKIRLMKCRVLAICSMAALLVVFQFASTDVRAQNTAFTFQGKLADAGSPASGQYDLQFKLYDAPTGGTVLGSLVREDVQVTQGIFTVTLDYGASFFLNNAGRFLEIGVRPGVSTGGFTVIAPRQELTAAPYSVKSLTADTATNSAQLGGVGAGQYVITSDTRLSDARNPLAGSGNYVQNQSSTTQSANFTISGKGSANIFEAAVQYNINGFRALASDGGTGNVFAGFNAGVLNTTGIANSFFGVAAGRSNTGGSDNSFFGNNAGFSNLTGAENSFFGKEAGRDNVGGSSNSFFGMQAGMSNTSARDNSLFRHARGFAKHGGIRQLFFRKRGGQKQHPGLFQFISWL